MTDGTSRRPDEAEGGGTGGAGAGNEGAGSEAAGREAAGNGGRPDDSTGARLGRHLLSIEPWWYIGAIVAAIALLALASWLLPDIVYDGFVGPYLWEPILFDLGFNPVNTVAFVLLAAAGVLWLFGLMRRYGVDLDLPTEIGGLAWFAWGASIRVLEDADMFAPFAADLRAAGLPEATSCAPGLDGSALQTCAGALFITPIVWIWVAILMFVAARVSLASQRIGRRRNVQAALQHQALLHGLLVAAMLAVTTWAGWIRFAPPWWVPVLGAAAGYGFVHWRAHVEGNVRWSWGMLGLAMPLLAASVHAVAVWFAGGAWGAGAPTHPDALVALLVGPGIVVAAMAWQGRLLSGPAPKTGDESKAFALLAYLLVVEAAAAFTTILGIHRIAQGGDSWGLVLAGPLTAAVGIGVTWLLVRGGLRTDARWAFLAGPVALLMMAGQVADGLMTALGLDVLGAEEKHLLPRTLVAWVDGLGLPSPLGDYPTALVMVLYKVLATLAVIWYLETRTRHVLAGRRNLLRLIQFAVANIGIAPALRNALRLAMGV